MVGSPPRDGANNLCWHESLMVGSSLCDLVFRRVPIYHAYRSRVRTWCFISVASSCMVISPRSPFDRSTPLCPSGACRNPGDSCQRGFSPFQQRAVRSRRVILRYSPLADSCALPRASSTWILPRVIRRVNFRVCFLASHVPFFSCG